jgi:hypothetical protein
MFSMDPPPLAAIPGAKARTTESVPKKWVSISSRILPRSPTSRSEPVDEPALLISRVVPAATAAAAATEAGSVMSSATGFTPGRSTLSGLRAPA